MTQVNIILTASFLRQHYRNIPNQQIYLVPKVRTVYFLPDIFNSILDNTEASSILFIGTIQGLVMQSLLVGDLGRIRHDAPIVFAIYLRGIRSTP